MSSLSVEVTQVITLPSSTDGTPPLISCVAVDGDERFYLTDELNHRVLGFDPGGNLLWSMGSRGSGEGQFRYPRGICTGWIEKAGTRIRCLAVADSWNERVCFLDLAGNPLQEWRSYGESPFGQIIDLRYVPPEEGEPGGTWLLLDRTRHRLLALTESSAPLFSAGQELPPSVKAAWQVESLSILRTLRNSDVLPDLPPRDYLYYPYRLLGQHPESLMIWEPLARTLKVSLWGSFLPITHVLPDNLEWVTADSSLLLGWDPDQDTLHCVDGDGTALGLWPAGGRPIPSNEDPPACWIQVDSDIRRLRISVAPGRSTRPYPLAPALLSVSAAQRSREVDLTPTKETVACLGHLVDELRGIADALAAALISGVPVADGWAQRLRVEALQGELLRFQEKLPGDLLPLFSPIVDWRHATVACECHLQAGAGGPGGLPLGIFEPLRAAFRPWTEAYDRLRLSLAGFQGTQTEDHSASNELLDSAAAAAAVLRGALEWFYGNVGPGAGSTGHRRRSAGGKGLAGSTVRQGQTRTEGAAAATFPRPELEESTRIRLSLESGLTQAAPFHMCPGPQHYFWVSLSDGNQVWCLDTGGRVFLRVGQTGSGPGQLLQPTGVLFDSQERLWVSEAGNRRVQVWSPPYDPASAVSICGLPGDPFERPIGLLELSSGEILVADALKHRIWKIDVEGNASIWPVQSGSEPGQVLNPTSFTRVPDDPSRAFWLVDRANHRLQKFDELGGFLASIGGCGLDAGCLFEPRAAAPIAADTLVVVEDRIPGSLVQVKRQGTVITRLLLDYVAGAVITLEGSLLVTDVLGNCIRSYRLS